MYTQAGRSEHDLIAMLLPDMKWSSIRHFDRPDKIPESRLFHLIDQDGQAFELCLLSLIHKPILDRAIRQWHQLQRIIRGQKVRRTRDERTVSASACGHYAYLFTPLAKTHRLKDRLSMLTTESVFLLAVDISILLYWLHKRPLDLRLEQLDDLALDYIDTLWMFADSHTRHDVNRLNDLAEQCQKKRRTGKKTPVFNEHAPGNLCLSDFDRLRCPYPPYIVAGDPWLDLIRHLMIFEGHLLPFRELLINCYFDLTPQTAFFNTLFLYELNSLCKKWQCDMPKENDAARAATIKEFASRYVAGSPIPSWYEPPQC